MFLLPRCTTSSLVCFFLLINHIIHVANRETQQQRFSHSGYTTCVSSFDLVRVNNGETEPKHSPGVSRVYDAIVYDAAGSVVGIRLVEYQLPQHFLAHVGRVLVYLLSTPLGSLSEHYIHHPR